MSLPPPPTSKSASTETAVIYFGAASVSLLIAEVLQDGTTRTLEYLDRPLPLAQDIFRNGSITRSTAEQAVSILRDFIASAKEYHLTAENIRLHTTNILSEAPNPEVFLNRLQVASGCDVNPLDEGDMTRLIYLATLRQLKANPKLSGGMTLVSHIGPGNTRAMYFKKGRIAAYASYRLGIFRAREAAAQLDETESPHQLAHLEEQIKGVVDHLAQDFSSAEIEHHLAIGAEIQTVAPLISPPQHNTSVILEQQLAAFTDRIALLSPDQLVRQFHLHYTGSEGIIPALQTNLALARRFADHHIHVPATDFQRDLLLDILSSHNTLTSSFAEEIISSAREVGVKYKVDQKHADHVMSFAQQIFRELRHLHGLGPKAELILRTAAALHEVGMFVSAREHHKHSLYLILNTELFGLSTQDRTLVALLARYHRRYNPEHNHPHFSELPREQRMTIFKLASILRIADALDRTHSQRITSIQLHLTSSRLTILTPGISDTTIEQAAINSKCDLFRETFGYEIHLQKA